MVLENRLSPQSRLYNLLLKLSSRYTRYKFDKIGGTLNFEQEKNEFNRIISSLVDLVDMILEEDLVKDSTFNEYVNEEEKITIGEELHGESSYHENSEKREQNNVSDKSEVTYEYFGKANEKNISALLPEFCDERELLSFVIEKLRVTFKNDEVIGNGRMITRHRNNIYQTAELSLKGTRKNHMAFVQYEAEEDLTDAKWIGIASLKLNIRNYISGYWMTEDIDSIGKLVIGEFSLRPIQSKKICNN